jgi:hypothetical protein
MRRVIWLGFLRTLLALTAIWISGPLLLASFQPG